MTRVSPLGVGLVVLAILVTPAFFAMGHWLESDGGALTTASFFLTLSLLWTGFDRLTVRQEPVRSPGLSDDIEVVFAQLSSNFEVIRRQATHGYYLAAFFFVAGFAALLSSAFGGALGLNTDIRVVTAVASAVMQFVSGGGVYLYNRSLIHLERTSSAMLDIWRARAALQEAREASLPPDDQARLVADLIRRMAGADG